MLATWVRGEVGSSGVPPQRSITIFFIHVFNWYSVGIIVFVCGLVFKIFIYTLVSKRGPPMGGVSIVLDTRPGEVGGGEWVGGQMFVGLGSL